MFQKILGTIDKNARVEKSRSYVSGGITIGLVAVLGAGMWAMYPKGPVSQGNDVVAPIIRADVKPYKTIPENPGGMEIPHRDSTVFETLKTADATDADEDVEQLLPESEQPMERDEIFAKIEQEIEEEFSAPVKPRVVEKTHTEREVIKPKIPEELLAKIEKGEIDIKGAISTQPAGTVEMAVQEKVSSEVTVEDKSAIVSKPIKISVNSGDGVKKEIVLNETQKTAAIEGNPFDEFEKEIPVEKDSEKDDAAVMAKTEPAAGPVVAETVNIAKDYFVQLGSVQSEEASAKEWQRLQKLYSSSLSDLDYRVQSADLGQRGIYYRIQGGPVTEEKARTICNNITEKKPGGCLVIKP